MRTWAMLAALAAAVPAGAQQTMTVWIKLPAAPAEEHARRLQETERLLAPVLESAADRRLMPGPALRLSGTAARRPEAEAAAAQLQRLWGAENLAVEFSALSPALPPWARSAPAVPVAARSPIELGASLSALLPERLLAGEHGGFYDNNLRRAGAPAVFAAGFSASAPAAAPAAGSRAPRAAVGVPSPQDSGDIDAQILSAAREFRVDPALIRAIIAATSNFNPEHASGGGYGLMAVSPGTARAFAAQLGYTRQQLDLKNPVVNTRVGAALLAGLCRRFNCDSPEGRSRALAAYVVGPKAVIDSGGVPGDPVVKRFLERVELAYRGTARPVVPVAPEPRPNVRQLRERAEELVSPVVPDERIPARVARWMHIVDRFVAEFRLSERLQAFEIDARKFVAAMILQESQGNARAVGRSGEQGLMQLMPETGARLGVRDAFDPVQNIRGGVRYFSELLARFNDPILALSGYNGGPNRRVLREGKIARPTENHVRKVTGHYAEMGGRRVDLTPYLLPRQNRR